MTPSLLNYFPSQRNKLVELSVCVVFRTNIWDLYHACKAECNADRRNTVVRRQLANIPIKIPYPAGDHFQYPGKRLSLPVNNREKRTVSRYGLLKTISPAGCSCRKCANVAFKVDTCDIKKMISNRVMPNDTKNPGTPVKKPKPVGEANDGISHRSLLCS